jgi:alanine dehydrogenase
MDFGVVRERHHGERRVALTPSAVSELVAAGHGVIVEGGAGIGASFADEEYHASGAEIAWNSRALAASVDVLVKVQAPLPNEELLRPGLALAGFLHVASAAAELRALYRQMLVTAFAFELLEEPDGERPVLEPQAAIGGRVAIHVAAGRLLVSGGGEGKLLGGAPGVVPLHVVILGAGTAGEAAAREAIRMGARVTAVDRDPRALARIQRRVPGLATLVNRAHHLSVLLPTADVLLGAVAVPGQPTPKVLSRQQVALLAPGSLFLDLSIDEGGCAETSRTPAPGQPADYLDEGVRHVCIPNLAAECAHTASRAFANSVLPYLADLARLGVELAARQEGALGRAVVYRRGQMAHAAVAAATGEPLLG